MKRIVADILLYSALVYILSSTVALDVNGGIEAYFFAGVILALGFSIIKPVLNLISLPFMMVTFGLFSLILGALILWGLTIVYPAVSVHGFNLDSLQIPVQLPSIYVPEPLSYVLLSAIMELTRKIFGWLTDNS